ncbi:hypothetical protein FHS39_001222 [Streptomyces olivoverticillatus]|uniref:Uncharacterized protein n=1 Tax=Streptomyces olivoverticillatus TaxID=66427 RepID=A0A7W7LM81_9ACTN|nr:hypothetical protein [Streptomyces olivoverticillatus]MBB4892211.1 hypothetical protein [Streptomyces olivoverticillatus]
MQNADQHGYDRTGTQREAELRARVRETNERSRKGRDGAGAGATTSHSPVGCAECTELEAARRSAAAGDDHAKAEDATIAVRSHFRNAHLLPKENPW